MKKYIYLLKTKPGLARPMINELKNLVQANILMESKSEVKVEMTNIDMLKFLERSFLLEKALIKVKSNLNADTEKSLKISLKKVKFENFLPISKANTYFLPNVIVTSFKSKLFHTKMISNIIRSNIQKISNDSFYFHDKDKEKLTQLSKNEQKLKHTELPSFSVFLEENKMSIFMDFSRKELAKRGYKLVTKGDSLKESIASSLILLSLNEKQILWDPFCGCGTILIEALLQINNVKVRSLSGHDYLRDLKFINECEETLNFLDSAQKSNSNKLELVNKQTNTLKKVYGSDISSLAINATRENFKHASLYEELSINFMENPVIHKERINAITDLYLGDFEKIFGIIIQENFIKTL